MLENSSSPFGSTQLEDADKLLLERLPMAVCVCASDGTIIRYNRAASELWGRSPEIGSTDSRYTGAQRLFNLDGTHVPPENCPMAIALKTGRGVRKREILIERPDGTRIIALINIEVLTDEEGKVAGAINAFYDNTEKHRELVGFNAHRCCLEGFLQACPFAVYTIDAAGRITFANDAVARLWGARPEIGEREFGGSWKFFWPDGTALSHEEYPMALSLREKRAIEGVEVVVQRLDGTRIPLLQFPAPCFNSEGDVSGGINVLVEIAKLEPAELASQRLAAIVECSDDAIVSTDLDGILLTWNAGAERLYGYSKAEVIGKPVTILLPEGREDEEPIILSRIRLGQRIDNHETLRRRKDGSLVEVSLCVSPIANRQNRLVGASKIARDITERKRTEEQRSLLLREMNHRIKNLFTVIQALVNLSARSSSSPDELAFALQERLRALANAHDLTLADSDGASHVSQQLTSLHQLIRTTTLPFTDGEDDSEPRVVIEGPDAPISGAAITSVALFLHEFAVNAAKYGALSHPEGRIRVECHENDDEFFLNWREFGLPMSVREPSEDGFGSVLTQAMISRSLGGAFSRQIGREGLVIELAFPRNRLTGQQPTKSAN